MRKNKKKESKSSVSKRKRALKPTFYPKESDMIFVCPTIMKDKVIVLLRLFITLQVRYYNELELNILNLQK